MSARRPTVVWINGAFGAGKTSVAAELATLWRGSRIFDPEQIGFLLRDVLGTGGKDDDFQDLPVWRRLTLEAVAGLKESIRGPLIVPMTLIVPRYFDEIVGELRRRGVDLCHVSLQVSPATLERRLRRRDASEDSKGWARRRIESCVAALAEPEFEIRVAADSRPVREIVEEIDVIASSAHTVAGPRDWTGG